MLVFHPEGWQMQMQQYFSSFIIMIQDGVRDYQ